MRTKMYLCEPEKMEATVEITMTIAEFEQFLDQTKDSGRWPTWKVRSAIEAIVRKARSKFVEVMED